MANPTRTIETKSCSTCGASFSINSRYSAAQKARARFCSYRCSGLSHQPVRRSMADMLGGQTRFAKLTFLGEAAPAGRFRRGTFKCDCGVIKPMAIYKILNGKIVSCGCEASLRAASRMTTHGGYKEAAYTSWRAMLNRCYNKDTPNFASYGGRGIQVFPAWRGEDGYRNFLAYMGPRPRGHSIDRIDNERGYEPGNVRWATAKEQQNNRRVSKLLTYDGLTMNPTDWAAHLGLSRNAVRNRLDAGWSLERALTTRK